MLRDKLPGYLILTAGTGQMFPDEPVFYGIAAHLHGLLSERINHTGGQYYARISCKHIWQ